MRKESPQVTDQPKGLLSPERTRLRHEMEILGEEIARLRSMPEPPRSGERTKLETVLQESEHQLDSSKSLPRNSDETTVKAHRKSLRKVRRVLTEEGRRIALQRVTKKKVPRQSVFIGVDLGGTNAQVAAVTGRGEVVASAKVVVAEAGSPDAVVGLIAEQARAVLQEAGVERSRLQGLGVGAAGTIDFDRGMVVFAPNLNWRDVPIQSLLQERMGVPVYLDNDVNVGTLGEWALGAGRGYQNVVGVFWGTGIGGGLVVNGQLYRGANGMAAEVGHLVVDPSGPKCGCGNFGCMEAIAGRRSITRDIRAAVRKGESTVITTLVGRDPRIIRSGALREAVSQKDPVTLSVLNTAAKAVGLGLANIANMIDPEVFIIGGGVVEALGEWIVAHAAKAAVKDLICADRRRFVVLPAELGDNGGALGAAILAMQNR
ncbi:MAG: ROK family protein [Armatimonadetes bacterium]|nr:ROK family protein [Armatimonadota bacterium]